LFRLSLLLTYIANEADALARQRLDEPLILAVIANRGASGMDMGVQRGLGDDAALPDGPDEIVLADYPFAVRNQIEQEIEDLRLDRNRTVTAAQLAATWI
jgi:hypothetical protein